ncbi:hypothetical protein AHAS_Ahas01G0183200 [Arachis hypogaea]
MQHERVPKGVCREVKRLQRNFIWGDEPNKKRLHLIGWKTMCLPRHEGGLGFRKLSSMNDAFLIKILWQMDENPEQMWVKVLKHKYCDGNLIDDDTQKSLHEWQENSTSRAETDEIAGVRSALLKTKLYPNPSEELLKSETNWHATRFPRLGLMNPLAKKNAAANGRILVRMETPNSRIATAKEDQLRRG